VVNCPIKTIYFSKEILRNKKFLAKPRRRGEKKIFSFLLRQPKTKKLCALCSLACPERSRRVIQNLMITYQKAQLSLVSSVLSYGAKAFVLIYCLLLIFFSLSEITTALIKSVSFKVDFFIFVKPMLIILPSLLSVAVPYVFLITIFLVIRKLRQDNFFKFTAIYPVLMRYLFGAGLLVSVCLSGVIYLLQENVLEKFDRYIEEEIRNSKNPK
jgi:hypothetical protein